MFGHSPLFESLTEEEQRFLLERSTSRTYTPGTVIFHEGEASRFFYLVMEGDLDIVKSLNSIDERVIKLVRAGEVLGEMSLLHQTRNRTASARARSTVRVLEIPLDEFEEMLKRNAGLWLVEAITAATAHNTPAGREAGCEQSMNAASASMGERFAPQ